MNEVLVEENIVILLSLALINTYRKNVNNRVAMFVLTESVNRRAYTTHIHVKVRTNVPNVLRYVTGILSLESELHFFRSNEIF